MQTVRLALQAMATRFELVLSGEDPVFLRAAGEEALAGITRLEQQLSFYDPTSEISHINQNASKKPVQIRPNLYSLLKMSANLHSITRGAFDITVGPLMRCWGFVRDSGAWPSNSQREEALRQTGMDQVVLDDSERTVFFKRDGMAIDLGAIGKGYAIEEAAEFLEECQITSALLHGGTSTMVAIGTPSPKEDGWSIGITDPHDQTNILASVTIRDRALSISAPHGKAFQKEGQVWGHVIDPRIGYPVQSAALSAVVHSSATVSDAVSTALLTMDRTEMEQVAQEFDSMYVLCAYSKEGDLHLVSNDFPLLDSTTHNDKKDG